MTVVSIRGPEGTLKSSFAATWGGHYLQTNSIKSRVFWGDLELGAHRAAVKIDNKLVSVTDLFKIFTIWHPANNGDTVALDVLTSMLDAKRGDQVMGRIEYWDILVSKYVSVLKEDTYQLHIYDTWKELWSANTQSYLQHIQIKAKGENKIRQVLDPMEYATPNARMRAWVSSAKAYKRDLVLISHERTTYVQQLDSNKGTWKGVATDKKELDGWKETLDLTDWGFATWFDEECPFEKNQHPKSDIDTEWKNEKARVCKGGFHSYATIEKSPIGADLKGKRLINPTWDKLRDYVESLGRRML